MREAVESSEVRPDVVAQAKEDIANQDLGSDQITISRLPHFLWSYRANDPAETLLENILIAVEQIELH